MKTIYLFVAILIIPTVSFAQTTATLTYKYSVQSQIGMNELNKIIYIDGSKSMEYYIPKKIFSSSEQISETEIREVKVSQYKRQHFVLKNLKLNTLKLAENIGPKYFLIDDSLNNFKWNITKEHKKILNYNCTKATVNFRGRIYTAWFAESIPLRFGPWKFGGLPGLILQVSDSENKFVYELTGIDLKSSFDKNLFNIPLEYEKERLYTHAEFIEIYNKKVADYKVMSKIVTTDAMGGTGRSTITLPEKQEKF
ncbi:MULTISPECIES: GLPGLI family protein [unclassified Pedobacter]|uniref:GLPGLI family protein n=1 Tax=unclassified Pedobacter TaxID=2628915 RepID=UPI001E4A61BB|nr:MULTISPECIES: GLPGLI family protein [unclassified Pedobacter]